MLLAVLVSSFIIGFNAISMEMYASVSDSDVSLFALMGAHDVMDTCGTAHAGQECDEGVATVRVRWSHP